MHRREYKRKAEDAALEEAADISYDITNWWETWPSLIEKAKSSRIELRVSALQAMNKILTQRYIKFERFEEFLDDTYDALQASIMNYASREEHDEALLVICHMSLNFFTLFEPTTQMFLDSIMPNLNRSENDEAMRFFTAGFLLSFSVTHKDLCVRAMNLFFKLMINKQTRATQFSHETIIECLSAITLLTASLPEDVVVEEFMPNYQKLLDLFFEKKNPQVLLAMIKLIPILQEALSTYEIQVANDKEAENKSKDFLMKYKAKLFSLGEDQLKKADKKSIKSSVKDIVAILEGRPVEESLTLLNQDITISGIRKNYILNAIRRITTVHFQNQMSENVNIHELFEYHLVSAKYALRRKNEMKGEIQHQRVVSKKEREMAITKQRRKKDGI